MDLTFENSSIIKNSEDGLSSMEGSTQSFTYKITREMVFSMQLQMRIHKYRNYIFLFAFSRIVMKIFSPLLPFLRSLGNAEYSVVRNRSERKPRNTLFYIAIFFTLSPSTDSFIYFLRFSFNS